MTGATTAARAGSRAETADFLVIGGGIAGAAAGCFLAPHGSVLLLEAELAPGMHATGRSAALFSEYFGNPTVRALTSASRDFYTRPSAGFEGVEYLRPRGSLVLSGAGPREDASFERALVEAPNAAQPAVEITREQALELCPVLRPEAFGRAMFKPGAQDIDVDAVHQYFLKTLRGHGGRVQPHARVRSLSRSAGVWHASTVDGEYRAPVVVNAAGAWADEVAALAGVRPAGLVARRRTIAIIPAPAEHDVRGWPMIGDLAGTFYAKPESGGLLVSPCDATPQPPGDARPHELDVALGLERLAAHTTLRPRRVAHSWAGLRSSPADDVPVIGPARAAPGFHWLAGLGGYGIQSAPAAGRLLAALVAGVPPDPGLRSLIPAVDPDRCAGPTVRAAG
jgi:D-arginine dehydrogenase